MQTDKKKTITGSGLFDGEKTYTFKLMDAETGLEVFHHLAPLIADILPSVASDDKTPTMQEILALGKSILQTIPFPLVKGLAQKMLGGCEIKAEDEIITIGEDDVFGDWCLGKPIKMYEALFWALVANFPDYLDPLLSAGDDESTSLQ